MSTTGRLTFTVPVAQPAAAAPKRVAKPGTLPPWVFDQTEFWIDPLGFQRRIDDLQRHELLPILDYILAKAYRLRIQWSIERSTGFDERLRARQWMLERPGTWALLRRFAEVGKPPAEEPQDSEPAEATEPSVAVLRNCERCGGTNMHAYDDVGGLAAACADCGNRQHA